MRNHGGAIDGALGITPSTTTESNIAAIEAYCDPSNPEYDRKRARLIEASKTTDFEFHAPEIEIGWFYPSVDFEGQGKETRHDGQIMEDGTFDFTTYHPTSIPGHNLPHAWLQKGDETLSTRDLMRDGKFVLITGAPGKWAGFANDLIDVEVIGKGGWLPTDARWSELCGIREDGAILVRPDGVVAWRAKKWKDEFEDSFSAIFDKVLGGKS